MKTNALTNTSTGRGIYTAFVFALLTVQYGLGIGSIGPAQAETQALSIEGPCHHQGTQSPRGVSGIWLALEESAWWFQQVAFPIHISLARIEVAGESGERWPSRVPGRDMK